MKPSSLALTQEEAFELLAYLLTSAQGGIQEPPDYAIYRLVTAAERLARAWAPRASNRMSDYLHNLALQAPTQAAKLITGPNEFQDFIAEQISRLAQELKHAEETSGASDES